MSCTCNSPQTTCNCATALQLVETSPVAEFTLTQCANVNLHLDINDDTFFAKPTNLFPSQLFRATLVNNIPNAVIFWGVGHLFLDNPTADKLTLKENGTYYLVGTVQNNKIQWVINKTVSPTYKFE